MKNTGVYFFQDGSYILLKNGVKKRMDVCEFLNLKDLINLLLKQTKVRKHVFKGLFNIL